MQQLQLLSVPGSAGRARAFVTDALEKWDCGELSDDAALVVTELVSNAIQHAGTARPHGSIALTLELHPGALRISVENVDAALPIEARPIRVGAAGTDDEHGRGLMLVEAVSDRWGAQRTGHRTVVWAELQRSL